MIQKIFNNFFSFVKRSRLLEDCIIYGCGFIAENDRVYENIVLADNPEVDPFSEEYLAGRYLFRTFGANAAIAAAALKSGMDDEDFDELQNSLKLACISGHKYLPKTRVLKKMERHESFNIPEIPLPKLLTGGLGTDFMDQTLNSLSLYLSGKEEALEHLAELYIKALSYPINNLDKGRRYFYAKGMFAGLRSTIAKNMPQTKYFNGWWSVLFIFLSFNLIPIPFAILVGFLGDWVYQNPVEVDMNYLGLITMHPIADNLVSIFSMSALITFVLWRMRVRYIPFDDLGSFTLNKKDLLYGTLFLAAFILLEEIYMRILGIEMPMGFLEFMLSEPLILGLISVVIIAPIIEEFIFRGFLYSQLCRTRIGPWGAVTLSSLLWTVIHFQYEALILIVLFIFGIFLGYIRMAYTSISLPIVLHGINNLFAFFMAYYFY